MPAVFVHGVPDTQRVWHRVIERLQRKDIVTLSLPGFGTPLPASFDCRKESYVQWLIGQLQSLPQPIDIVGHDWGAILVLRAACEQPELIRTCATGGAPIDRTYQWHQIATLWQTPQVGEQLMASVTPETMRVGLAAAGVPQEDADEAAKHIDERMKDSILKLYRSAINAGDEWEDDLPRIAAPGLVMWGNDDPYATPDFGARLAQRTSAKFVSWPRCSHWWQLQRPDEVVGELESLWAKA